MQKKIDDETDMLKSIDTEIVEQENNILVEKPKVLEEKRHLLLIVFHVIQNMNSDVLFKWFSYEGINSPRQLAFLELFQNVLVAFEYVGKSCLYPPLSKIAKRRHGSSLEGSKKVRTRKPGWGIKEWNEPEKSIALIKQQRQYVRAQFADVKLTDDKAKKNMLSYFKQPRSMSIFSPIFGSGERSLVAKQIKRFDEDSSPTPSQRAHPSSPKGSDEEAFIDAFVEVRTLREKHMSANSSFYVLSSVIRLIDSIEFKGMRETDTDAMVRMSEKPLMEQIVRTMIYFLHLNQSERFLIALHAYLRWFFITHGDVLFPSSSDFGMMLCESLMALCNSTVSTVREQAAATMYILVRSSFMVTKGLTRPHILTTVALSRTLQRTIPEDDHLLISLQSLGKLAQSDPDNPKHLKNKPLAISETLFCQKPIDKLLRSLDDRLNQIDFEQMETFTSNVEHLSGQLQKLLFDTISVNQTILGKDSQKAEDLLYRISAFYQHIPELRFLWLKKLAYFHKNQGQYDEAVQCHYRIAAVVFNQLRNSKSSIVEGLPLDNFYNLTPYLIKMKNSNDLVQGHLPYSNEFTEKGVVAMIRNTIEIQTFAEQYEHAIPLLKMLIPLFEKSEDYTSLSLTHGSIRDMFELINTSITENSRIYSTFYRLRFYGDGWGQELAGKHYIYKMGKLFKLFKMKNKVVELFGDDVEFLTNLKVDPSQFASGKKYLQFTSVKPLIEDDEDEDLDSCDSLDNPTTGIIKKNKTKFEHNVNISKFYYETAFTKHAKKLSDKVTGIYKRKIILVVQNSFPDTKTRLSVIDEYERILTPIESAIENMQAQIRKLEDVLETNPPDISQLQLVLQGSVRAKVNGGPQNIIESFLPISERFKYTREHVTKLNYKCQLFLLLCESANGKLNQKSNDQMKRMNDELDKGLKETKIIFQKHLEESQKVLALRNEYAQREALKSSVTGEDASENVEEGNMHENMHENTKQTEGEMDDLLPVPYNRNYKSSVKRVGKIVVSLKEFITDVVTTPSSPIVIK